MAREETNLNLVKDISEFFNNAASDPEMSEFEASLYLQTLILLGAHHSNNPKAMEIAGRLNSGMIVKAIEELGKEMTKTKSEEA